MSNSFQDTYNLITETVKNGFIDRKPYECHPVNAKIVFDEIEALGESAFEAIDLTIQSRNAYIEKLFTYIGKPSIKYLLHASHSIDRNTRYNSLEILGNMGEVALETIIQILYDYQDEENKNHAANILITRFGGMGLNILYNAINEGNNQIQQAAISALSNFLTNIHHTQQTTGHTTPNQSVKNRTNDTIDQIKNLLIEAMEHSNPDIRNTASNGLRITRNIPLDIIKKKIN